jgi:hypothetical protein
MQSTSRLRLTTKSRQLVTNQPFGLSKFLFPNRGHAHDPVSRSENLRKAGGKVETPLSSHSHRDYAFHL